MVTVTAVSLPGVWFKHTFTHTIFLPTNLNQAVVTTVCGLDTANHSFLIQVHEEELEYLAIWFQAIFCGHVLE